MTDRKEWMNDDQWYCAQFLADLFGGFHHVQGKINPATHRSSGSESRRAKMNSYVSLSRGAFRRGVKDALELKPLREAAKAATKGKDRSQKYDSGPKSPRRPKLLQTLWPV